MADEKEFDNLVVKAGIKALHTKEPYRKICELLRIPCSAKESKAGLKNLIIASNVANPTRDFAEVLTRMPVSEQKVRVTKKSTPVVIHANAVPEVLGEEKKSYDPITYPLCDASLLNREALSEQIHAIHNFLRNRGVGYGMSALKIFNLFYGLARIEQFDLFAIIGLDTSCKFSKLVSVAKQILSSTTEVSNNAIYELTDQYQDKINAIQMTRKFMMSELPDNISNETIARLVIDIDRLIQSEIQIGEQICGKVYEYFIGRDQTAISELGAYFTNRSITQFIYEQLAPELDSEGRVQSMIDPFGGSGGFTTGYVMNMCARFSKIDWKDGISRVYHFDMNNDVVRYAALEIMCLTRALPNMCDNMICENSFATERFAKYKYVCTNPPYGGDNIAESTSQKTRKILKDKLVAEIAQLKKIGDIERLKRRELQLTKIDAEIKAEDIENDKQKVKTDSPSTSMFIRNYARENNLFTSESRSGRQVLFGNDKEATSLILIAALVAPGGTAVGVLKEGVFFNSKYTLLRKHLIEKFNVRKVISIPSDQFENTTTKTSIIFFDNDPEKKTSRIEFSELKVTTYEQDEFGEDSLGNLVVIGARGAFREVHEHPVSSASLVELQKMIGTKQPFSLDGKQYSMREIIPGPGYKMIKLGNLCAFMTKSQHPASFGKSEGKYPFYSSSATIKRCDVADYTTEAVIIGNGGSANIALDKDFSCSDCNYILQSAIVPIRYIYYILRGNIQLLQYGFHGSVLAHVSKSFVSDLKIPVLEDSAKMNEWVAKISAVYDSRRDAESKMNETYINAIALCGSNELSGEWKASRVGDMCTINSGEYMTKVSSKHGPYPVYGGGDASSYVDTYNNQDAIVISKDAMSKQCVRFVHGKFFLNHHGWVILPREGISLAYLFYSLLASQSVIYAAGKGSVQKGLTQDVFSSLELKFPPTEMQSQLDQYFDELSRQWNIYSSCDVEFKKLIAELAREAIVSDQPVAMSQTSSSPAS